MGFEGDYVNELNLAAKTGTSPAAARANLMALEEMGWLTCTKRQKGSAAKYKLAPLPKRAQDASLAFAGVVELLGDRTLLEAAGAEGQGEVDEDLSSLLADQANDVYAVQVLESARHAAWSYSRPTSRAAPGDESAASASLVHRDWVYLWAVATGADPASLGLSKRECTNARRDLRLAQVGPSFEGSLMDQLHRIAERTGATDRYRSAWAVLMDWVRSANSVARTELEGGPGIDGGPDRIPSWTASPDLLRSGLEARFTAAGYSANQAAALSRAAVPVA